MSSKAMWLPEIVTSPSTSSPSPTDQCEQHGHYVTQLLVISGVAIVVGLTICLAGYKLFKLILFLTGFFVGFFATYVVCTIYLKDEIHGNAAKYKDQIYLANSFAVGMITGLLTLCSYYLGLFVLGATLGWFLGMALVPVFSSETNFLSKNLWLPYSINVGCAVLFGLLIICLQKTIIILSTAFLGSLLFTNGIDYLAEKGRIINFTVNILHGKNYQLPNCWYTWLISSLLPLLFIIGVIIQYTKTSKGSDHRIASGRVLVVDAEQMIEMQTEDATPLLSAEYT
ncbi:transmembrane protein 198-like [Xenia sp. Carnegie-2017]|uniref:transmembrane protein 198-like n=1 Tax=Xenia sp. Carnegie-2017 TaxID=2897299 RepID=UPI001F04E284|nr:transmembrane protein 198-like [Xenia sp. Carnegie-2017]